VHRHRIHNSLSLLALVVAVTGCASTGQPTSKSPVSRSDRPYFLSPLEGYPLTIGPSTERRIQQAYQDLVENGKTEAARTLARELLAMNPGNHPATVLDAQALAIDRENDLAITQLGPVLAELPGYTSGWLLFGRIHERVDDVVGALVAYSKIAESSSVAAQRAQELEPRGAVILRNRIDSDITAGRFDDAMRSLQRLQEVAPNETATLEAAASVARANGDAELELQAVRALHARDPDDRSVTERRAELEVEVGDASDGMRMMRELAAEYPDDSSIEEKATRAEFLWRLQLLPPDVQEMARKPEVDRGDFATLVFWLFPEVRYGGVESARIANDVLEHPHRNEIVRVINLGLMDVDPSLHRFEPYRPVQRIEALGAILRFLGQENPPPACLGPRSARLDASRAQVCEQAAQCRLIGSQEDCLPTAPMTGLEVVDLLRESQELAANR